MFITSDMSTYDNLNSYFVAVAGQPNAQPAMRALRSAIASMHKFADNFAILEIPREL